MSRVSIARVSLAYVLLGLFHQLLPDRGCHQQGFELVFVYLIAYQLAVPALKIGWANKSLP